MVYAYRIYSVYGYTYGTNDDYAFIYVSRPFYIIATIIPVVCYAYVNFIIIIQNGDEYQTMGTVWGFMFLLPFVWGSKIFRFDYFFWSILTPFDEKVNFHLFEIPSCSIDGTFYTNFRIFDQNNVINYFFHQNFPFFH